MLAIFFRVIGIELKKNGVTNRFFQLLLLQNVCFQYSSYKSVIYPYSRGIVSYFGADFLSLRIMVFLNLTDLLLSAMQNQFQIKNNKVDKHQLIVQTNQQHKDNENEEQQTPKIQSQAYKSVNFRIFILIMRFNIAFKLLISESNQYHISQVNEIIVSVINRKKENMNYRHTNFGHSYYENGGKLNYSTVSKGFGLTHRNQNFDELNGGELQFMLQNQRKKFKETKQKFEHDLDNERKMRIQFQNKLIRLKDEFSRKDVQISELEFKVNNLLHQNQDFCVENDRLKGQLMRLQEIYGGKIRQLEQQMAMESRNFEDTTNQYNSEFEKFKKEGQDYVEQLTFEYDRKLKNLEEKAKIAQNSRRELALENKKLNDVLINNKLAFEEEIRDLKNKAREQEIKKSQHLSKTFEQKLRVMQQGKESLQRKNQELLRGIQDQQRRMQEIENQKVGEIERFKQDNTQMNQQINHLNYLVNKLKSEIGEKDGLLGRANNMSGYEVDTLKQQLESKRQEIARLALQNSKLSQDNKEFLNKNDRKVRELQQINALLESEVRRYKEENQKIVHILKSKINETINTVSYRK